MNNALGFHESPRAIPKAALLGVCCGHGGDTSSASLIIASRTPMHSCDRAMIKLATLNQTTLRRRLKGIDEPARKTPLSFES